MSRLVAFSGKAQAGKSQAAKFLEQNGFEVVSFASAVKQEVSDFMAEYGVVFEERHLYGTIRDKEELLCFPYFRDVFPHLPEFLEFAHIHTGTDFTAYDFLFTPRSLLQWWGVMQRNQDVDYWVRQAEETIDILHDKGCDVVIDDCRFSNEANMILANGGELYRITRKDAPVIQGATHSSETGLDEFTRFTGWIENDGNIGEFQAKVLDLIDEN